MNNKTTVLPKTPAQVRFTVRSYDYHRSDHQEGCIHDGLVAQPGQRRAGQRPSCEKNGGPEARVAIADPVLVVGIVETVLARKYEAKLLRHQVVREAVFASQKPSGPKPSPGMLTHLVFRNFPQHGATGEGGVFAQRAKHVRHHVPLHHAKQDKGG